MLETETKFNMTSRRNKNKVARTNTVRIGEHTRRCISVQEGTKRAHTQHSRIQPQQQAQPNHITSHNNTTSTISHNTQTHYTHITHCHCHCEQREDRERDMRELRREIKKREMKRDRERQTCEKGVIVCGHFSRIDKLCKNFL